jgi:hypothetical protein
MNSQFAPRSKHYTHATFLKDWRGKGRPLREDMKITTDDLEHIKTGWSKYWPSIQVFDSTVLLAGGGGALYDIICALSWYALAETDASCPQFYSGAAMISVCEFFTEILDSSESAL